MITLDELLALAERQAHRMLLEEDQKQLLPTFGLVSPDGSITIIGCPWDGDLEKKIMIAALRRKASEIDAVMLSHVSEAWISQPLNPGVDLDKVPRPSLDPNRREVVIALATDGVTTKSRIFEIKRDWKDKINQLVLDETLGSGENFTGRIIDGILPIRRTVH